MSIWITTTATKMTNDVTMARNKKTIAQLEKRQRELLNRLVRTATELRDIDTTITKIKRGQLRQPPPKGKKVLFTADSTYSAEFDDVVPSFGSSPAMGG
jgi:hypothetical protein